MSFDPPPPGVDAGVSGRPLPPVTHRVEPTPPISGGTLAISGDRAVVSDPDRASVVIVDLPADADGRVIARLPLASPPGRAVIAADGIAYVAHRDGGLAVFDTSVGQARGDFAPCPGPTGLALDGDRLHVACRGGALVTLDRTTGREVARTRLAPDLRDVVVVGDRRWVSRFTSAEIMVVDARGDIIDRLRPPVREVDDARWLPRVAWRMRAMGDGRVGLLHQLHIAEARVFGSYQRRLHDCDRGLVQPALTVFDAAGALHSSHAIAGMALAVDFAATPDRVGFAGPGEVDGTDPWAGPNRPDRDVPRPLRIAARPLPPGDCAYPEARGVDMARPTGVAVAADGRFAFHSRSPAALYLGDRGDLVALADDDAFDSGHDLFHVDAGGGIACAACHPEGGDDGHTWRLDGEGPRKTPPLIGDVSGTAPLHWAGDLRDLAALLDVVMHGRMGGPRLDQGHVDALTGWLDGVGRPPYDTHVPDPDVERGRSVFSDWGCADCHRPPLFTDHQSHDVGSGGAFQTPPLRGLLLRDGLMHDGCGSLGSGFSACASPIHQRLDAADAIDAGALLDYLRTL